MKKFLLFSFFFAGMLNYPVLSMEQPDNSSKKEEEKISIQVDDDTFELDKDKKGILEKSITIKNMIEDLQIDPICLVLQKINKKQFDVLCSYLEKLFHKKSITSDLDQLEIKELIELLHITNFYDIPDLLQEINNVLIKKIKSTENRKKYIENPEYFKQFDSIYKDLDLSIPLGCSALGKDKSDILALFFNALVSKQKKNNICSMIFNNNNTFCVSASLHGPMCVCDSSNLSNIKILAKLNDQEKPIAFNKLGTLLVSKTDIQTICFYDISNPNQIKCIAKRKDHTEEITCSAFNEDGTLFATASGDHTVCVYDLSNPNQIRLIKPLKDQNDGLSAVIFNKQGTLFASASKNGSICFYEISKQTQEITLIDTFNPQKDFILSIAFNEKGTIFFSCALDKPVCIFDLTNLSDIKLIKQVNDHKNGVRTMAINKTGNLLATASYGQKTCDDPDSNSIYIYDISNLGNIKRIKQLEHNSSRGYRGIFRLRFNEQGNLLASLASSNAGVSIFDVSNPTQIKCIAWLDDKDIPPIHSIHFCKNRNIFVSESSYYSSYKQYCKQMVCIYDLSIYNNFVDFITHNININQALFLIDIATEKNPIDLTKAKHLLPVYDSFDPKIKKELYAFGKIINVPLSYSINDFWHEHRNLLISTAIGSTTLAAVFGYWYYNKK